MNRPRVTIAGSMGLVALAAAGIAALKNPTRLAASLVFSLALATIVAAGVTAFCVRGRARAFWGGFAACGGIYLLLSLGPWFEERTGPHLATTALIDLAYSRYDPKPRVYAAGASPNAGFIFVTAREHWSQADENLASRDNAPPFVTLAPYSFYRTAHSLFALIAAAAGGLLAICLTRSTSESPDHP